KYGALAAGETRLPSLHPAESTTRPLTKSSLYPRKRRSFRPPAPQNVSPLGPSRGGGGDALGCRALKRNGASLAADPTLTGVWAPRGRLTPGVSMPVRRTLASCVPAPSSPGARAGAGSVEEEAIARIASSFGSSETSSSIRFDMLAWLESAANVPAPDRPCGLSDFAPSRLQRSERQPKRLALSSTTRHLAVVSLRFQNPFVLAGLSAFASEGPIPVAIVGRCASLPIRASANRATYPLWRISPVDKAG